MSYKIAGYFGKALGVGEVARRLLDLLYAAGCDVSVADLPMSRSPSNLSGKPLGGSGIPKRDYALVTVVNPDQMQLAQLFSTNESDRILRNIAMWSWELEETPVQFSECANFIDEVWTYSNFMADTFTRDCNVPVKIIKLPAQPLPTSKELLRLSFGIDQNAFICLTVFDFFSGVERKNPLGAVEAYLHAFPSPFEATLFIKCNNIQSNSQLWINLQSLLHGRPDIVIIDKNLTAYAVRALIKCSDVLLSLHRSEGFGFNIFDAITDGVAAVATGYSGNLDFMNFKDSPLVDYELVEVGNYGGYKTDAKWAEPNTSHAALILRDLFESPDRRFEISLAGKEHVMTHYSLESCVDNFTKVSHGY